LRAADRFLQRWRIRVALPWVRDGDRLLDIGCFDRSLIDRVAGRVRFAVGVDPELDREAPTDSGVRLLRGHFPEDMQLEPDSFDCVTGLAVVEHLADPSSFARACHRVLRPGGRVVLTVPHPVVDRIVDALIFLRLADGMSLEEHHAFDVGETVPIFEEAGFRLRAQRWFQLGLNRLFVFEKPDAP